MALGGRGWRESAFAASGAREGPTAHTHQPAAVSELLAKSFEWVDSLPVFLAFADVLMAFHFLHPEQVGKSLIRLNGHPYLIGGLLREGTA